MVPHLVHHQPKESAIIYQIGKIVKQFSFRLQNNDFKISKANNKKQQFFYYILLYYAAQNINKLLYIHTYKEITQRVQEVYKIS